MNDNKNSDDVLTLEQLEQLRVLLENGGGCPAAQEAARNLLANREREQAEQSDAD